MLLDSPAQVLYINYISHTFKNKISRLQCYLSFKAEPSLSSPTLMSSSKSPEHLYPYFISYLFMCVSSVLSS